MRIALTLLLALTMLFTSGCDSDNRGSSSSSIVMPSSSEEYCGTREWSLESLENHFRELGFSNFDEHPVEPDEDDYRSNIYELYIQPGFLFSDPWEAGDEFSSDATIVIYYNERPMLTPDEFPELKAYLTGENTDYESFAKEFDGQYIMFDGHVSKQTSYFGGTSHIMSVAWGDAGQDGPSVRVVNKTGYGDDVRDDLPEGTNVRIEGYIDYDESAFFNGLCIGTLQLFPRDN